MECSNGHTSVSIRQLIIFHYKNGKSLREIGKIVNRTHSTVQGVITRYKKTKSLGNKTRSSSKKIFNERDERWIVKEIKKNPFLSAPKLAKMAEKHLKRRPAQKQSEEFYESTNFTAELQEISHS
ncbi:hypothetical protein C0J52_07649 [Blattella germanica]|nr:hypothetical protein C0J52_07649 [Blattella germanica]